MTIRPLLTASGSHARLVALLAEHRELTDAQLQRRYQSRAYRTLNPWPVLAESSLRTRRDELAEWGEVIAVSRDGLSASKRPMRVWALNPVPHMFANFDGEPVSPSPGFSLVVDQLRTETDDLVVLEALAAFARRVGADLP